MLEWWTYRPADFLLFSQRVYWRLFELHNQSWWPLQCVALLLGILMLLSLLRPQPRFNRLLFALLAMNWLFVAWSFLWQRYAVINWAANYAVALFVIQAGLLIGLGTLGNRLRFAKNRGTPEYLGLLLFGYALLLHPFAALLAGRTLLTTEVFGIVPDPLAIATLGLLSAAIPNLSVRVLLIIPIVWCLASWLTLDTMGAKGAWIPLLSVILTLAATLWPRTKGN
jgi:hypothetical protein